jgi:hypothetical protein
VGSELCPDARLHDEHNASHHDTTGADHHSRADAPASDRSHSTGLAAHRMAGYSSPVAAGSRGVDPGSTEPCRTLAWRERTAR